MIISLFCHSSSLEFALNSQIAALLMERKTEEYFKTKEASHTTTITIHSPMAQVGQGFWGGILLIINGLFGIKVADKSTERGFVENV